MVKRAVNEMRKKVPDRRRVLVEAAYRAVAHKGFEGLRLRDVARAAGIDHSTLHHHFPAKRDLIAAVVDYATQVFLTASRSNAASTTLRDHLRFLGRMIAKYPELHVVLRELDLRSVRDASVDGIIAERERGWRTALIARLSASIDADTWPAHLDTTAGADLVIAVVKGASLNPKRAIKILNSFEELLAASRTSAARAKPGRRTLESRRS